MRNLEKELCGAEPQTFAEGVLSVGLGSAALEGWQPDLRRNMAAVPGVSGLRGEVSGVRKTWAHINVHSKIHDWIRNGLLSREERTIQEKYSH